MGTTRDALEDNPSTAVVFVLAIEGHDVLYCTDQSLTAAVLTAWATFTWFTCRGGLEKPTEIASKFEPFRAAEVNPEVMSFRILDPLLAETMFATELATGSVSKMTTSNRTPTDGTITAKDVSGFAASGDAFIGTERFTYTSKTGTTVLNSSAANRGQYAPFAGTSQTPSIWGRLHQFTQVAGDTGAVPYVSDYPRVWTGKWVGLWAHRVLGGVVDTRANAELLWSGTIADHGEDEDGHVRLSCVDARDRVKSALLLNDQFSCRPEKGINIPSGQKVWFFVQQDTLDAGQLTTARIVQEATGTFGTDAELPAGVYTPDELQSALQDWLLSEGGGAGAFTEFWHVYILSDGHSQITYAASTGAKLAYIKVELCREVARLLGLFSPGSNSPTHIGSSNGSRLEEDGYHATQLEVKIVSVSPVVDYAAVLASELIPDGNKILKVGEANGTFFDQLTELPIELQNKANAQNVADGGSGNWGLLDLGGKVIALARKDSATQFTCLINNRLSVIFTGLRLQYPVLPDPYWHRGEDVPTFRQVVLIQGVAKDIIPRLFASTGTAGYNHATYDDYAANIGAAIPWDLLGDQFVASVNDLWETSPTFTLFLDRPTRLSVVLESELQLRGAHLALRAGQLVFLRPALVSSSSAVYTLTESNKTASDGDAAATRSRAVRVRDFLINHLKVSYSRTIGGTYRDVIEVSSPQSVTDHGEGSPLTIEARNHVSALGEGAETIREIVFDLAAFVLSVFSTPLLVVSRQTSKQLYRMVAGDAVTLADNHVRSPATGAHGISAANGWVLSHRFDWSRGVGSADIVLLPRGTDRTVYAPCADVDETKANAGYTVAGPTLELKPNIWSESTENEDGTHFVSGDAIYAVERSPANPAAPSVLTGVVSSYSAATNLLTLTGALTGSWDNTKAYRVFTRRYTDAQASQKTDCYLADDADDQIQNVRTAYVYSSQAPEAAAFVPEIDATYAHEFPLATYWDSEGYGVTPAMHRAAIDTANNLINYKTSPHHPWFWETALTTQSLTYVTVATFWQHLGPADWAAGQSRTLTIQPIGKINDATKKCKIRVTSSALPPTGTAMNATFAVPYSQITWELTGSTADQAGAATTLTLHRVSPAAFGSVITVEIAVDDVNFIGTLYGFKRWALGAMA